jgi:hypothetical protein
MIKASDPIFVYINTHIINIIHHFMYAYHNKRVWGTELH